ncbi:MAG: glutamate--cysteine ligase [Betaproteobacteria bacterium]|nr:glutamate--cysteine ligase [Betaproteobacteria bacterium]
MGQEIADQHFRQRDFEQFRGRLVTETGLLRQWFEEGRLASSAPMAGIELEAWLTRPDGTPAPANDAFLWVLDRTDVVHELARFNVELNATPQPVTDAGLARLHAELEATWAACSAAAASLGLDILSIGILPTLRESDLSPASMSDSGRYRALNEQVLRQRRGRAISLDIPGVEHLRTQHSDVMLEAGATSFQGHLQLSPASAARWFNASLIASAATVAAAANSPFLFGHRLWEETRIPLFEQAVAVGSFADGLQATVPRVGFGTGYASWSVAEVFRENLDLFPIMLPLVLPDPPGRLPNLRLHNGTIWRWNRPLIGFEPDGTPHLRLEHRVMAAGPSIADMMANLVFFYGLVAALATQEEPPELTLPFAAARDNFYAAARYGLDATVTTTAGRECVLRTHMLDELIPRAEEGLALIGAAGPYAIRVLEVVERRIRSGRTGARWQCAFMNTCHGDPHVLTREYLARQKSGLPVHDWTT